jgi:hypothetical protein
MGMRRAHVTVLVLVAVLAIVAYLPVLQQPLIQDDYPNLEQARVYGPVSGWGAMWSDGVFRYRATFWVMTWLLDRLGGPSPAVFYAASILLHILCAWLVYALGAWRAIGWRIASVAAAFFAVAEGHQEAVMWYSASAETLMCAFGLAGLWCWIRCIDQRGGAAWYAAALALFTLALLSKESAVVLAVLYWLPVHAGRSTRRARVLWLGFVALALADVLLIFGARGSSFRFHDGSFSLSAPFWLTLPVSFVRLFWFWGVLALAVVLLLRVRPYRQLLVIAGVWAALALVPYSFLTYMHRVPSRQTYLASVGLAWVFAAGFRAFEGRLRLHRSEVLAAVALVVIAVNVQYLWTKKRAQFAERAAPTQALLELARKTPGPIFMHCYPGPGLVYEAALRVETGRPATDLVWDEPRGGETEFCFTTPPR